MTKNWNRQWVRAWTDVHSDCSFRVLNGTRKDEEPQDDGDGYVSVGRAWLKRHGIPESDLD